MTSCPIIDVNGGPAERGGQHGQALADSIARFHETMVRRLSEMGRPISERDATAFALSLLPESRTQAPDLVAEVEAIAQGASMPFECVWLLNCFDEIGGYWRYKDLAATKACTTFAATGRSTIDGRTIIGQNWDMGDSHYESVMLRIAPADDEIGGLVYTHPGIVGGMGMNRAGVSLVWNSLQASDAGSGVPVPFLIRLALRQPKLAEAIHATLRPLRAIGFNFVLASPDGAANIEASARDRRVTYVVRHLAHGNNYEAPELRALDLDRTFSSSSLVRAGRMRQLLDEHEGSLDIDRAMAILRDHAHYPGSICAHADPPFQSTNGTLASMVLVPADRAFLLAVGPPCGAEYERLVVA